MKFTKVLTSSLVVLALIMNVISFTAIQTEAHDSMLNVEYDPCVPTLSGDGMDETWYILNSETSWGHISHETMTIKYYIANTNGAHSWTSSGIDDTTASEIKAAYVGSMEKWNNVYFYSYDDNGDVVKKKIVNVVEGTYDDHNLSIYPVCDYSSSSSAETFVEYGYENMGDHVHYPGWRMNVNVIDFYANGTRTTEEQAELERERTGAHELGHIFGLLDVDSLCPSSTGVLSNQHHFEILMGYGYPITDRATDITYKDIAGVAITRGFHTDEDHKWLNAGIQDDGTYKLICSICNGVIYADDLSEYTYSLYGACNSLHTISSGNMMAVASYGESDYYKCKYCRYVAPFESNSPQNYEVTSYTERTHTITNNVQGLNYSFTEYHFPTDDECYVCGYANHIHEYTSWVYYSKTQHIEACECGAVGTIKRAHAVSSTSSGRYRPCIGCGALIDTLDNSNPILSTNTLVTQNGSYILPNGIIVLVDADVNAYLTGELIFYNPNDETETH